MLVAGLLIFVPIHMLLRLVRIGSSMPRLYLGYATWVAGARVRTVGKPLRRDVVFLANHVSWIDIPAIAGRTGSAFVSKAELRDAPVVGWLSTLNRTIFVAREDRMGVTEQIERLREALAEVWAVTIFPESTTTEGRSLLPFKGALLAVLDPPPPGVMVQPVLLDFGETGIDIAWIGEETGLANALRVLTRSGSFPLTIHFLEPFDPAAEGGRKAIAARAKASIEAALSPILGHPVPAYVGHDFWTAGDVAALRTGGALG